VCSLFLQHPVLPKTMFARERQAKENTKETANMQQLQIKVILNFMLMKFLLIFVTHFYQKKQIDKKFTFCMAGCTYLF